MMMCPILVGSWTPGASAQELASFEREAYAMGTRLEIRVAAVGRETALRASEAALRAVQETESLLSTWRTDTELARLNTAIPGHPVGLPESLHHLLVETYTLSRETEGAFDPVVGALIDIWDLRGSGRSPTPGELAHALTSTGRECFQLTTPPERATRSCPAAWIDAGGFGKGVALRRARNALVAAGAVSAHIDFGGQWLMVGEPPDGRGWTTAVAHPARRAQAVRHIRIPEGSVATSGQSERGVTTADGRAGHILDPRTGRPVPAWGSVTVVARDPVEADVLSTALYVMGPDAGLAWLRDRPDIAALFLVDESDGLDAHATRAMRALLIGPAAAVHEGSTPRHTASIAHDETTQTTEPSFR